MSHDREVNRRGEFITVTCPGDFVEVGEDLAAEPTDEITLDGCAVTVDRKVTIYECPVCHDSFAK